MSRGHLNERYVQEITVDWLANHYRNNLNPSAVVPTLEACVKKSSKCGYGRADGLIALQMDDGTIYTVSLEAKSSRTRHNLRIDVDKDVKLLFHTAMFASTIMLFLILLGVTATGGLFFGLILPILVFIGAGLVFLISVTNLNYYQPISVIKQVKGYPANEKWIALSADVYNQLDKRNEIREFENQCSLQGIGLIKVSSKSKISILINPIKENTPQNVGCFLEFYSKEKIIRSALTAALNEGDAIAPTLVLEEPEKSTSRVLSENLEIDD